MSRFVALIAALAPIAAAAQEVPVPPVPPVPPTPPVAPVEDARLTRLDDVVAGLDEELARLRDDEAYLERELGRLRPLAGRLSGYVDLGFFAAGGDGSGVRSDRGHREFPEYEDLVPGEWVLMGDPLSTAVNSRGEPASTGASRAVAFDSIGSGGDPTFVVNAVNVKLRADRGAFGLRALADLVPRSRDPSDPDGSFLGDFLDVKLAFVRYETVLARREVRVYLGKIDSVLGFEYRTQEASERVGVTPSLVCRYVCGRPLGVSVRAQLTKTIGAALAVTNGSHFVATFPFQSEVDENAGKTVAGRASYYIPVGAGIELGASGAIGTQDQQAAEDMWQWHWGADAHVDWRELDVTAEFVHGRAPGGEGALAAGCDAAPCLTYKAAYGQVAYRATNWLTPYARVDWRDALHEHGVDFVYVSQLVRVTAGVHIEPASGVFVKVELMLNRELGRIPEFPNDVLTSSLVMRY